MQPAELLKRAKALQPVPPHVHRPVEVGAKGQDEEVLQHRRRQCRIRHARGQGSPQGNRTQEHEQRFLLPRHIARVPRTEEAGRRVVCGVVEAVKQVEPTAPGAVRQPVPAMKNGEQHEVQYQQRENARPHEQRMCGVNVHRTAACGTGPACFKRPCGQGGRGCTRYRVGKSFPVERPGRRNSHGHPGQETSLSFRGLAQEVPARGVAGPRFAQTGRRKESP
jgi:hypothetical protein